MMNEKDLCTIVDSMVATSVGKDSTFIADNQKAFRYFMGEKFGNEEKNRSQVVSTDVADVHLADMASLTRVFLGAGSIVEFTETSERPDDLKEAEQKNLYIPTLIRKCPNSFKKQYDFLSSIGIYKAGVLEYGFRKERKSKKEKYSGLNELELAAYLQEFEEKADVKEYKITSQNKYKEDGEDRYDIEVSLISECNRPFLENIAIEDLILSKDAQTKDDADIVGKKWEKTRGELVAMGFDKDKVKALPKNGNNENTHLKDDRQQGSASVSSGLLQNNGVETHWTMEKVSGVEVYSLIDYDEDGIRERRHIIKSGTTVILNEDFDHVPFVITSAIQIPHVLIGRSRADLTMPYQEMQSMLLRGVINNIAMVNAGRNVVSDKINIDDLLAVRDRGVIRYRGQEPISNHIMPLMTEYVGDKNLQVIQYIDNKRAQSTGSLLANQGLEADDLYKETATRFKGTEDASKAKIELLSRIIAEIGYVQLYEGMAWFARHFQDDEQEIYVLGQTLTVNPSKWRYEQMVEAQVGTGAGDTEKLIENGSALLSLLMQLKERGSVISDDKKIYNQIKKIAIAMGIKDVSTVANDPEKPEQILLAENGLLKQMVQQLQQQAQSNPLVEPEMIKAQASMKRAEADLIKAQGKNTTDMQRFIMELAQKDEHFRDGLAKDLTALQLQHNKDIASIYNRNEVVAGD